MNEVFQILLSCWKFDIMVFSKWWLYAPFLIPAMFYLAFFFVKWIVLTAPAWLPIAIIAGVCKGPPRIVVKKGQEKKEKTNV